MSSLDRVSDTMEVRVAYHAVRKPRAGLAAWYSGNGDAVDSLVVELADC